MTKANAARIKTSLERTRLKLKSESLELEKRRREYGTERAEAIGALRLICERYGTNDWADETPLREVLEDCLAAPLLTRLGGLIRHIRTLEAQLSGHEQQARLAAAPGAPAPTPPRPRLQAVEEVRHSVITIQDQDRRSGQIGYRASCVCTWRSSLTDHQITATQDGGRHVAAARRPAAQGAVNHA